MPLLDRLRFSREPSVSASKKESDALSWRLERMIARQKPGKPVSTISLDALEGEYSEPLYDASVYASSGTDPVEV